MTVAGGRYLERELRWLAFALPWKCRVCKQVPVAAKAAVVAAKAGEQPRLAGVPPGEVKEGAAAPALQPFQAQEQVEV